MLYEVITLPDDAGDRRFRSRLESIPDELTGADEKQVPLGGKNFRESEDSSYNFV